MYSRFMNKVQKKVHLVLVRKMIRGKKKDSLNEFNTRCEEQSRYSQKTTS